MKKTSAIIVFISLILLKLPAEEPYTGWQKIRTRHFTIIFEEKSRKSADEVALFCEEVYTKVTDFFHSYPENILCIIHDRIDTANGSFYPIPPQINLYVTSPSTPLISALNRNWLKVLLIHELTHYVNLTFEKGIFYHVSKFFGKSISTVPAGFIPGWAVEGIAVKLETDLTEGGRGRNPFFEMEYKAQILENNFYNWEKASYPSYYPPHDRIYQAGYLLNDYLARTYGNDIFVRIYSKYLAFPFSGFNHAVQKTTGSSVKEIFSAMRTDLQNRYTARNASSGNLVSPDKYADYYLPVITEKGWILYRKSPDEEPALVIFDPETKKETILLKTFLSDYTSFSADQSGNVIVFSSFEVKGNHPAGNTIVSDLFLLSTDKHKVRRLTYNKHLWQPALSPDGKKIIAVQKEGQYSRLVKVDSESGFITPLFNRRNTTLYNPVYSNNGKSILFTLNDRGDQNIWILTEGKESKNLTAGMEGEKYFPRFYGKTSIIFSGDRKGRLALYRLSPGKDTDTQILTEICDDPVGAYTGIIHNNTIVYGSYTSKGYCLKEKKLPVLNREFSKRTEISYHKILNEAGSKKIIPSESFSSARYIDFPRMIVWLPVPFSLDPLDTETISFAPGIISIFQSPLAKTRIDVSFSLLTSPVQPEGSFKIIYDGGYIQSAYSLYQGYSSLTDRNYASQTTMQDISLTFPLITGYMLGTKKFLYGNFGVMNEYSLYSSSDFSFFASSDSSLVQTTNEWYLYTGFSSGFQRQGSPKDIIPPAGFSASSTLYFPIAAENLTTAWKGELTFSAPSIFKHQVVRAACKWGWTADSGLQIKPNPRGFTTGTETDGKIITGLDYLFSLGIWDIPIPGGFSFQGLAGGFHVEKELNFSFDTAEVTADSIIYTGIELTILGGYLTLLETGGIGVNVRIDPVHPGRFEPEKDIGFYLYLGTDSFRNQVYQ